MRCGRPLGLGSHSPRPERREIARRSASTPTFPFLKPPAGIEARQESVTGAGAAGGLGTFVRICADLCEFVHRGFVSSRMRDLDKQTHCDLLNQ